MIGQRKALGALLASGALLLTSGALSNRAIANGFQGRCTTTSPATCTLDEPEGENPATHGTVTVTRSGWVFTFDAVFASGTTLSTGQDPIQLCLVADTGQPNPYSPTNANTCAGAGTIKFQAFPAVYDAASLLATPDAPVFFAMHVNVQDGVNRTTYVIGSVNEAATTTTMVAPTTTTTVAPTTTTTTTTVALAATVAPTTTTVAEAPAPAVLAATVIAGSGGTTTTTAATTTTGAATATTRPAAVLGAVFEASTDTSPVLPRTGSSPRVLLLLGSGLLLAGVVLLVLSSRRSPRGVHR